MSLRTHGSRGAAAPVATILGPRDARPAAACVATIATAGDPRAADADHARSALVATIARPVCPHAAAKARS